VGGTAVFGSPPLPEAPPEVEVPALGRSGASAAFEGAARTEDGRIQVMVELEDPPAAVIFAEAMADQPRSDLRARQVAGYASQAQVARIEAAQEVVAAALADPPVDARELFRVQKALNGIAVAVSPRNVRQLERIPGVKRVLPIYPEYPTNSTSVPFIGTPNVWANTIGLPAGALGDGISIGVIDTGLDYVHADFGGTGLLADYQAEAADTANFTTLGTAVAGAFPTAKVVGGTDFAGDAYTGQNAPVPDANPMDCNGHGSHVAGTAAGVGVTAAGAPFAGPYDANPATYSALRIGPGTAPMASLYGLRVFGCAGSTSLTVAAIDWAMDPNGDASLADHLDVINMSLGSNFGAAINATAVASDNAALAGVIVVASAGNAGDTFFITGAPGSSARTISTAASVDDGLAAVSVQVSSPPSIAGSYLAGGASFGPAPSGQTADGVIAVDPTAPAACGALASDACCPLTNGAAMAGRICVVDRGTCNFNVKAQNCQAAGAIGMVVVDNAPGSPPPGLGGTDPTITIPSVRVTQVDGTSIKNTITATPPVNMTLLGANGGDTLASFSSRGPRRIFGSPLALKPDIAAPGQSITSVQTGRTCLVQAGCTGVADPSGFQAGSQTLTISGTSMASPHMAGVMALLRQLKPDWQVEELKALAMNYATQDVTLFPSGTPPRFGLARVGAGRVRPDEAALGDVVAMNAEDVGLVSVTFQPEVSGIVTQTKKVRVVNHGTSDQTYDLAIDTVVDSPGVSFSLPGGSTLTVGAGDTEEIDVQMSADSSLMDHTRDASLFPTQGVQVNFGDQPRNFLTEEGAYVTFSQSAAVQFRLPVYMAERPAAMMAAADTIVTGGAGTGSTTIPLSGLDLCTGTLAAGPTCLGSFPTDVESLVTPFELQVVSGLDPVSSTDYADIHYAGVAYLPGSPSSVNNDLILFGVASWGDWSTLDEVAYNICVDTNEDGVFDRNIVNTNPAIFVAQAPFNDNFVRATQNTTTAGFSILGLGSFVNLISPSVIDTALHLNNVMFLGATPAQLGMVAGDTTFRYRVTTCPATNPACARTTTGDRCSPAAGVFFDRAAGPFFWNWAAQGLDFGGSFLAEDLDGNSLPVTWNTANMTTNGSAGALLLHHHNGAGKRAEVVMLDTALRANLAIAKSVDLPAPTIGQNVTVTLTVTNNGPDTASGIVVSDFLPVGLTYVSDDGAGAYVPATGLWTVPGSLAVSSSVALQIVATVDQSGAICNQTVITSQTPLDPSPADNQATACVNAPLTADLLIGISASSPTVLVGGTVTYDVTVTNNGDDPAYSLDTTGVFAPPNVPPGSYFAVTTSQGVFDPGTGLWDLASLGTDATATLQYSITAPNMAGNLTNTVSTVSTKAFQMKPKAFDPNLGDNSANAVVLVLSPASVSAAKSVAGNFVEGGTVTYSIVLSNSSAFDQQDNPGFELTDALPAQLTLVSADDGGSPGTFSNAGNTVNWNGVVPGSGLVTLTVTATINAGTALQTVSNQATVNFDTDGNGTNESSGLSDDPAVGGASDPTNFVVASPSTVGGRSKTVAGDFVEGGSITYTVTLTNSGGSTQLDNPGNELVDVLPAQLTLVSASATSGTAVATVATNTVTWNGSIAASGGMVTITIDATVDAGTALQTVSNQGTVSSDADGNGTNELSQPTDDPGEPGVADTTSFQVLSPASIGTRTKTVAPGPRLENAPVTYTVTISNPSAQTQLDNPGDEFVDLLPPQLTLVSASATSGTAVANVGTNTVTWNGSIAANGGTVTITIDAIIEAGASGQTVSNQGTISFDADGNGTNESQVVTDDPGQPGADDPTSFLVAGTLEIPTLSQAAALLLALVLAGAALIALRPRG
jgi:uncharacterized repeat protein (TIGR01451 family)